MPTVAQPFEAELRISTTPDAGAALNLRGWAVSKWPRNPLMAPLGSHTQMRLSEATGFSPSHA